LGNNDLDRLRKAKRNISQVDILNWDFPNEEECYPLDQWRTQKFFSGGVQQIQLTEGRENRDLGAVVP
jgi:hypothetical protein